MDKNHKVKGSGTMTKIMDSMPEPCEPEIWIS